jgi:hypothetical protein
MAQHAGNARSLSPLKVDLRSFFRIYNISAMAKFKHGSLPRSSTARKSEKL